MTYDQARQLPISAYAPLAQTGLLISDDVGTRVASPRFTKSVFGGADEAVLSINMRQPEVESWIQDGVGRHIEIYNAALEIIWEGFVNIVEANIGGLTKKVGPYLNIAKKIRVVYSPVDTTVTPPAVGNRTPTDWAEDADSQALYGEKHLVKSISGASVATAEQIRDLALNELKDPGGDETDNLAASAQPSVTLLCLGYIHYLKTYTCNLTTTGDQNVSAKIEAVLGADPNTILSTSYALVETNATQIGAYDNNDRTAWDIMRGLVAMGEESPADTFNRWLFRFDPGRIPVYSATPAAAEYQRNLSSPEQTLEHFGGGRVMPWDAVPGKWVVYTDLLVGASEPSDICTDSRYLFVERTTFRAPWTLTLRGSKTSTLNLLMAQKGLGGTAV
jgi:hypothetical protein